MSAVSDQSTTANLKKQNPGETVVEVHLGFLHYQLRRSNKFLRQTYRCSISNEIKVYVDIFGKVGLH